MTRETKTFLSGYLFILLFWLVVLLLVTSCTVHKSIQKTETDSTSVSKAVVKIEAAKDSTATIRKEKKEDA